MKGFGAVTHGHCQQACYLVCAGPHVRANTRSQLRKQSFSISGLPKPRLRIPCTRIWSPAALPSSAGISAPSKSEPKPTPSSPTCSSKCSICRIISSVGVFLSARPSGRRKLTAKLTPTRPPVSPITANCRSVRLRECGLNAWALVYRQLARRTTAEPLQIVFIRLTDFALVSSNLACTGHVRSRLFYMFKTPVRLFSIINVQCHAIQSEPRTIRLVMRDGCCRASSAVIMAQNDPSNLTATTLRSSPVNEGPSSLMEVVKANFGQ